MPVVSANTDFYRLRCFSSAFSRNAFSDVLNFNDYSRFDRLMSHCGIDGVTYLDFLRKIYSAISKEYPCEYVYKNELIKHLIHRYGTRHSVYFNEFRVGNSIADIVMFNGESKAFEIKTEYDTPRRLDKQMADYKRLFDKCYIVVPETKYDEYAEFVEPETGIIVMCRRKGRLCLTEKRSAVPTVAFDTNVLMSCLRISEYSNIATLLGATLDGVPGYDLYSFCRNVIVKADAQRVRTYFLSEMKKRQNNTSRLRAYPVSLRQMMLSLNLTDKKAESLLKRLNVNTKPA